MALIVGGVTVTGTQTLDATTLSGNLPALNLALKQKIPLTIQQYLGLRATRNPLRICCFLEKLLTWHQRMGTYQTINKKVYHNNQQLTHL